MPIPDDDIIDNKKRTMGSYLNEVLKTNPNANFDVATAFFEVGAYSILKNNIGSVKHFRLLLGKSPDFKIDNTLGKELEKVIKSNVQEELEGAELTEESESAVKKLTTFLKQEKVEVKLYDQGFLHGKAYIFDNLVVVGSSNFTAAGLEHNGELNAVRMRGEAKYVKEEWFEKFWAQSRDFKQELITLLDNSRFGSKEYTPYDIFIKALYELQKDDIKEQEDEDIDTASKVDLTDFQSDAITRIGTRLDKYSSVLIADSVGLGKTKIAAKIVEQYGFFRRKKFLVVCPAQLREMWRSELKILNLTEPILSLEELGGEDYLEKAKIATGGKLDEIELVVVDESHNLRNPLSNRWENFFTLIHDHISNEGSKPYLLFLTATPINNSIWDLYFQILLLVGGDNAAFANENIPDLLQFFKKADKEGNPTMLNDLLNEISIRRTRDYIQKNYPDAFIIDSNGNEVKVTFPKRQLENVNYKLDAAYQGLYGHIADVISEKLTMAYYNLFRYKKDQTVIDEFYKGRMIALEGIYRTILLKRLESSVHAFRMSVDNHVSFLEKLTASLKQGKLITKELYRKYLEDFEEQETIDISDPDVFAKHLKLVDELQTFDKEKYDMEGLLKDIATDIILLREISEKVKKIKPDHDAKLIKFAEKLRGLSGKGQVVVFTYYADTLDYIFKNITSNKEFKDVRIEKISGAVPAKQREELMKKFKEKQINIIMSTDVLSEGQNLQTAQYCINYDLHWNPTRMIQRAGRIDRIGSPFSEIYIYNFFPEDELEELLELVQKLQKKIIDIDSSVGLDQSILGESIHPKVFGTIRKIQQRNESVMDELEGDMFGGGEIFYQPLKEFRRKASMDVLEIMPLGIHSGLQKRMGSAIFFYYQYDKRFHYWLLMDPETKKVIFDNKTNILRHISCKSSEPRVIPDFFQAVYECNKEAVQKIEDVYKELEVRNTQQVGVSHFTKQKSAKFVLDMLKFIGVKVDDHMNEYPGDSKVEDGWEKIKQTLQNIPYTKKRLSSVRRIWGKLRRDKQWKEAITALDEFISGKHEIISKEIAPFDKKKLKLIVVDLVS